MTTEFRINVNEMSRLMRKLESVSFTKKAQTYIKSMKNITLAVERKLKQNISGRILKVRSGRLRNSIGSRVLATSDGIAGVVGSGVRSGAVVSYSKIHEHGGTITPKTARYLAIPLDNAKTASGVVRFSARDVFNGSAGFDGAFIRKKIIFGKRGKDIIPLFILKKSVKIPARKYMSTTLIQMQGRIMQIMSGTINRELGRN